MKFFERYTKLAKKEDHRSLSLIRIVFLLWRISKNVARVLKVPPCIAQINKIYNMIDLIAINNSPTYWKRL